MFVRRPESGRRSIPVAFPGWKCIPVEGKDAERRDIGGSLTTGRERQRGSRVPPCPALLGGGGVHRIRPTAACVRNCAAARPSHHPPGLTVTGCRVITSMTDRLDVEGTWLDGLGAW